MSSYEKACLGEPTRIDQGGRLSRGLSVLVIGALSILAWAVVICDGAGPSGVAHPGGIFRLRAGSGPLHIPDTGAAARSPELVRENAPRLQPPLSRRTVLPVGHRSGDDPAGDSKRAALASISLRGVKP